MPRVTVAAPEQVQEPSVESETRSPWPAPGRDPRETIRIVPVPRRHSFVRHIRAIDGSDRIAHLQVDPGGVAAPSYPARRLDARWIEVNHRRFDLFHVHFGFDAHSAAQLEAACDALDRHRKPLIYTVHDLRDPHHEDPRVLEVQFEVLARRAEEIVTLTHGAAAEISSRTGRDATVIEHPHVVPLPLMEDLQTIPRRNRPLRIGLHLKGLRASLAGTATLLALDQAVRSLPSGLARLLVDIHGNAYRGRGDSRQPGLRAHIDRLADRGAIELRVHDYLGEAEFFDYLAGLDVSVLPYRYGTHSGTLEACRDVNTAVLAPACGHYWEQGPHVHPFATIGGEPNPDSLAAALSAALSARSVLQPADPGDLLEFRRRQRREIAAQHRSLYERALQRLGAR